MPPRTLVNYVDEAIADVGMRVDRVTEAVQMQFTVNEEKISSELKVLFVALVFGIAGAGLATFSRR